MGEAARGTQSAAVDTRNADRTVEALATNAMRVGEVATLIRDIAEQTTSGAQRRDRGRARARRARASPRRIGGISADIATDVVRRLTDVGAIAANVREAADGAGAVARSAAGIGEAARRGLGSPGEVARMTTELAGVVDSFLAGARARRNEETGREASRRVATD